MGLNDYLFNILHSFAGMYWLLDWLIIFLGTYLGFVMVVIALAFGFRAHNFKSKFSVLSFFALSMIFAGIIMITTITYLNNPRPFLVLNFEPLIYKHPNTSFPSGHTTIFSALAFAMLFVNRKKGYLFILGAFLIGVGRVMAGVHWPIDILGGFLCGFLSAYIAYKIFPSKELLNS